VDWFICHHQWDKFFVLDWRSPESACYFMGVMFLSGRQAAGEAVGFLPPLGNCHKLVYIQWITGWDGAKLIAD
jgi:hypothetical protein